jgi:diguanylate cyclase (GGDEF)-like protein
MKRGYIKGKISTSNMLIYLLFTLILIIIFNAFSVTTSIQKYVSNDAFVINRLGQIRGSMQRMSKLMVAKKEHLKVQSFIEKAFLDIDKYYLSQGLIQKYQTQIDFTTTYNALKKSWRELKQSYDKDTQTIINISEECWDLADKMTTQAQKIAEAKKNDLIYLVQITALMLLVIISITLIVVYILVKRGLEKDRVTDRLTSLFNRYYFEEQIDYHIELFDRHNREFSIIFFDIDFFKKVNDSFGHDKGDDVLEELSHLLKREIRHIDFAFRYGGEEFIVLLPETNLDNAVKIAERLREDVKNYNFSVDRQITISLGVAEYKKDETVREVIKRADKYLYQAKSEGRDKVVYK